MLDDESRGIERGIKGYMLGQAIDYHSRDNFWNKNTTIILQILKVTNLDLNDYIGHLIAGNYSSDNQDYHFLREPFAVVSFDQKDYKFL